VIIGGILLLFGTQLLIGFSLILERFTNPKDETSNKKDISYIAPPLLNPMPSATNSASVNISGFSLSDRTVKLYVNGELIDETDVDDKKSFLFQDIALEEGENEIKAKSVSKEDKESEYSDPIKISYISKAPTLDVEAPADGQTFQKDQDKLQVTGRTDPGIKITVNDFWAMVNDEGRFSYTVRLQDGENRIKIIATDNAGNKTEKELKVTYSP